ncbi:DNA cytosine methyltransferase [Bosea sp. RAC05]|uniref:DNA cytosine methyltransferase n=1 Tax=Bosea sp. RAC05 TaxID=1842539 RepID=UPI00083D2160|nr:DNA (cytosine-5-)-methyltransferase [Bosea sp. RAC05]AOG03292.1 DNA (cytosine-5-)-methyltransferase family protein [Bosea sp. RAC05]
MKALSLFAGIGGFDIGFGAAGIQTELLCENAPCPRDVLLAQFPDVPIHGDIEDLEKVPAIDVICAGFPCQDLSLTGPKKGLEGHRSGLVSHVFRLLDSTRAPVLVLENVAFMLKLAGGSAMARLVAELEERGYRWAYRVVDARAFLPQRRERVILVASRGDIEPRDVLFADEASAPLIDGPEAGPHGFYWTEGRNGIGLISNAVPTLKSGSTIGLGSAPAILKSDGVIVTPDIRDAERLQGFMEGWTSAAAHRGGEAARWRAVGNAICVPVAGWVAGRLLQPGAFDVARSRALGEKWPSAAYGGPGQRHGVSISHYPHWVERDQLDRFIRHPGHLLSARATKGFLSRVTQSRSSRPDFIAKIQNHLTRMSPAKDIAA